MKLNTIKRTLAVVLSAAAILTGTMGNTFHTSAAGEGNGGLTLLRGVLSLAAEASQSRSGWDITPDNLVNGSGLSKRTVWMPPTPTGTMPRECGRLRTMRAVLCG